MFIHTWCNTMWPISIFWKIKKCPCVFCQGAILKVFITYHENKLPLSLFRLQCLQLRDLIISYTACQVLPTPHAPAVGPIQANYWNLNPHWEGSKSSFTGQHVQPTNHLPTITTIHGTISCGPLGGFMNNSMSFLYIHPSSFGYSHFAAMLNHQ